MSSRGKDYFHQMNPPAPLLCSYLLLLFNPLRVALNLSVSVDVSPPGPSSRDLLWPSVAFSGLVGDLHLENQSRSILEEAGRDRLKFG